MFVAKSVNFSVFSVWENGSCFLVWQESLFAKGAVVFVCNPFDIMIRLHNVIYGYDNIISANFNVGFVFFGSSVACIFDLFCHRLTATSRLYPTVVARARLYCLNGCTTLCASVKFHKNLLSFTICDNDSIQQNFKKQKSFVTFSTTKAI